MKPRLITSKVHDYHGIMLSTNNPLTR